MTPPKKPEYVEQATCDGRHGKTKTRLAILASLVLVLVAAPCVATGIAWSAKSKAEAVEVKLDAQEKFLNTTLSEIKLDLRELREWSRNGKGE